MGRGGMGRGPTGIRTGTVADEGQGFLDHSLHMLNTERDHIKGLLLVALGFMGFPLMQAMPEDAKNAFKTELRATCGDTTTMVIGLRAKIMQLITDNDQEVGKKLIVVSILLEMLMDEPDLRLPPRPTVAQMMTNPMYQQVWVDACYRRIRTFLNIDADIDIIVFGS